MYPPAGLPNLDPLLQFDFSARPGKMHGPKGGLSQMRGDSRFADRNVRPSDLLQRDGIKVINMADLARELSGETEETISPKPATVSPADYWKRQFNRHGTPTPLV